MLGILKGLDAPENTLSAARLAKKNGANFVHFDVTFSADGVAVASARKDISSMTIDKVNLVQNLFISSTILMKIKLMPIF
jgi:glycerophosphoryl diester phosphodiesterase